MTVIPTCQTRSMTSPDARIAQLAKQQLGVVTRRQALAVGFSDRMIGYRLRQGVWERGSSGIYRLAGVASIADARLVGACLKLPGAVVSHQAAARLHGFPFVEKGPAVVTVPASTTHRLVGVQVHESSDLASGDCEERGPVVLTGAVRTVVDLATVVRRPRFDRIMDELLAGKVVALEAIADRHSELARKGKPGTQVLREVLEDRGYGYLPPESELEARFLSLLERYGFSQPESQVPLPWRDGCAERVDFVYRAERLVIECDGRRWHSRERDFARDRQRDNEAVLAGWRVLRFTWEQIVNDERVVVAMLRQALAAQAA